jgi:hypothetical protein
LLCGSVHIISFVTLINVNKYMEIFFVNAGGWSVLREFSIHTWDYRQALQHLHALYGVSPFFKVSVVPDPRDPLKSIIQVRENNMSLEK